MSRVDIPPADCSFSVYPVNENDQVGKVAIITSSQVSSLDFQDTDPITGFKRWRITLNSEGASINAAYSKAHIGQKIAIFCGAREMVRPTIAGQSSGTFVIDVPD